MKYREAAVAGKFYPGTPNELKRQMTLYLGHEPACVQREYNQPKALIVPHAGYFYSGEVAAHAYRFLAPFRSVITHVVLLGPSHHVALQGTAVPDSDVFITPLGEVKIDKAGVEMLRQRQLVIQSERAHHWEHALEVQLPFLQHCLANFTVLPLVVGPSEPSKLKQILTLSSSGDQTLIVVSSDLSHYHPYQEAQRIDADTVARVSALSTDIHSHQACGCYAINGLMELARDQAWHIECLAQTNSGEVMAKRKHRSVKADEEVVGYASFVLY